MHRVYKNFLFHRIYFTEKKFPKTHSERMILILNLSKTQKLKIKIKLKFLFIQTGHFIKNNTAKIGDANDGSIIIILQFVNALMGLIIATETW